MSNELKIESITAEDLRRMYLRVADVMIEKEDYLTDIDNRLGDGDHGIGMAIGFKGIKEELNGHHYTTVNEVLHAIGMTMLCVMGGASGVLFGTVYISGIIGYPVKERFDSRDFAAVFRSSLAALQKRGKAKVGDKTMVDALAPAVDALEKAALAGEDLAGSFAAAAAAAAEGVEASKGYLARFGRAKYYGEKALGYQDAGATSVYLIFQTMADWLCEQREQQASDDKAKGLVVTVTLNPCIDKTLKIDGFTYGGMNRVLEHREDPSGKGINVSIALTQLGVPVETIGLSYRGGDGDFREQLAEQGIDYRAVLVEGRIRENNKVMDVQTAKTTELNQKGAYVSLEKLAEFEELYESILPRTDVMVITGSVPIGVPIDFYRVLIEKAKKQGCKVILDAEGELLEESMKAEPYLIKPNMYEFKTAFGLQSDEIGEVLKVAKRIIDGGVQVVCLSMDQRGALITDGKEAYLCRPTKIEVKSTQGAGDSLVAGLCMALQEGLSLGEMLRYGVCVAQGSLIKEGTQICTREDFERFQQEVTTERIAMG
ncbi:MAG: dihydroxyacetone kinase subunit DhaL [Eubacteriales bacterium]|nr:dihydroxyacetone kinase subunit DhaL [Eubacteriales bacterium]